VEYVDTLNRKLECFEVRI